MAVTTLDMMKGWLEDMTSKYRALEEENISLKWTIVTLTEELEKERKSNGKNSVNAETHVVEVNLSPGHNRRNVRSQSDVNNGQQIPRAITCTTGSTSQRGEELERNESILTNSTENLPRKMLRRVMSESDLRRTQQIPMTVHQLQIEETRECRGMNGSFMPFEVSDSSFHGIRVKEEPLDEFNPDNLQTETPSMDDDIDIKEEEVGYGYANSSDRDNSIHDPSFIDSPNVDKISEIPIKHEIDRSIQRMFRSPEKVANIELASEDFEAEVGTNHDLNHTSYLTKNLVCPTLDKSQPQLPSRSLYGHKKNEPYLKTRTAEKIECETCEMSFDTQFKLMEHIKCHTGEYPLTCFVCGKILATSRVLTNHMKTHPEVKLKLATTTLQVDHKGVSAKRNLNLTVENEKEVSLAGRSKKQRKVESEGEGCNDEDMPIVGEEKDLPSVVETNPLKIKKDSLNINRPIFDAGDDDDEPTPLTHSVGPLNDLTEEAHVNNASVKEVDMITKYYSDRMKELELKRRNFEKRVAAEFAASSSSDEDEPPPI